MNNKYVLGVVVALVIATIGLFTPSATSTVDRLGGSTDDSWSIGGNLSVTGTSAFTGAATFGTSGTALTRVNAGTCYVKAYATTITASSTATVDCQATAAVSANGIAPLTGVTNGDAVQVRLSTSTAGTTFMGLNVTGASASTTAGYITMVVQNLTGTTYTWPTTGTATGTVSYIVTR